MISECGFPAARRSRSSVPLSIHRSISCIASQFLEILRLNRSCLRSDVACSDVYAEESALFLLSLRVTACWRTLKRISRNLASYQSSFLDDLESDLHRTQPALAMHWKEHPRYGRYLGFSDDVYKSSSYARRARYSGIFPFRVIDVSVPFHSVGSTFFISESI